MPYLQNLEPAGPFLQYLGQEEGRWLGSVMIVLPPHKMHTEEKPYISFSAGGDCLSAQCCKPLLVFMMSMSVLSPMHLVRVT